MILVGSQGSNKSTFRGGGKFRATFLQNHRLVYERFDETCLICTPKLSQPAVTALRGQLVLRNIEIPTSSGLPVAKFPVIIIEYHFATKKPKLYDNLLRKLDDLAFKIKIEKITEDMGMIYALNQKSTS